MEGNWTKAVVWPSLRETIKDLLGVLYEMSRRRWRQKRRKKWIDQDPRKQGWKLIATRADTKVYSKGDKLFYVRW